MANTESHAVRNGVIATIIGGVVLAALGELWPPAKKAALWLWDQVMWVGSFFTDYYSIKGWILAPILLLALITVVRFIVGLIPEKEPAFANYVEDNFYGAKWRWSWLSGGISNLWCFCPRCDSELVYDDSSCHYLNSYKDEPERTDFICEHCHRTVVASIRGGNKNYTLSLVQREIRRKVRTNEYGLHRKDAA